MNKKSILICLLLLLAACAKDHIESDPKLKISTAYFDFTFYEHQMTRSLIAQSDSLYKQVETVLDYQLSERIQVDLTDQHIADSLIWKTIQVDTNSLSVYSDFTSGFRSRITAVFITDLSQQNLNPTGRYTHFFYEGLATYIAERFSGFAAYSEMKLVSTIMYSRERIKVSDLIDNERLNELYDTSLAGPLGLTFIHAITELYGPKALVKIAQAFSLPEFKNREVDPDLWAKLFKQLGYSFKRTVIEFNRNLEQDMDKSWWALRQFPAVKTSISFEKTKLTITAKRTGSIGDWMMLCHSREDTNEGRNEQSVFPKNGKYIINKQINSGDSIDYQFYFLNLKSGLTVYNKWQTVSWSGQK